MREEKFVKKGTLQN